MRRLILVLIALCLPLVAHAADRGRPPEPDDGELEISDVQRAAARAAGLDLHAAASLKRRAGNSAWLPEVTVRVKKENFANDAEKYNSETPYQTFAAGEGVFFEVGARWSLDRLVFDRAELDASRESAAVFNEHRRLMEEVGRLFHLRKALAAELASADCPKEQAASKRLKLEETTALLDALCAGCVARDAARRSKQKEKKEEGR
jgi:hypothetical protein